MSVYFIGELFGHLVTTQKDKLNNKFNSFTLRSKECVVLQISCNTPHTAL